MGTPSFGNWAMQQGWFVLNPHHLVAPIQGDVVVDELDNALGRTVVSLQEKTVSGWQ